MLNTEFHMNVYTWKVAALDVAKNQAGLSGVVVGVHYTVNCSDGTESVGAYGSIACDSADGENFVSYENLSESQVIEWVKQKVDVPQIEAQLSIALETTKNPPIVKQPLPWIVSEQNIEG